MLRFVVYNKARQRKGWVQAVDDPSLPAMSHAEAHPRHNALSDATVKVDADHHLVPLLTSAGTRCVVEYLPAEETSWMRLFSGPVKTRKGEGWPATRTFTIGDDKALLWNLLGWPKPGSPIGAQTDTHWKAAGPAETVFKQLVAANAGRYGIPVTIAPDQGRGGHMRVEIRMQPLADKILPGLDQAGLGFTVVLAEDGSSLVVDVYEKRVHTMPLSDQAGVIRSESPTYSDTSPTVTDVIMGAGGQDAARYFTRYQDTARRDEWGQVIEVFRDARDVKPTLAEQPDRDTILAERAMETLVGGGPSASLNLELAETTHFKFGKAVLLGDVVKASVAGGPELTDTVREVVITQTTNDSVLVVPKVGEKASDPDNPNARVSKAVAHALKTIRHLSTWS